MILGNYIRNKKVWLFECDMINLDFFMLNVVFVYYL